MVADLAQLPQPAILSTLALAFVFGLFMGSFLNCLAWRITHGESVLRGRSHCASCGHVLEVRDLVPVLSWLLLGGRCRFCGERISARYPIAELACGYGGGVPAMKAMGGSNLPDDELKQIVDDWRRASPNIVRLWYRLEQAAMTALKTGLPISTHRLIFRYESTGELRFLTIQLPSGRKLLYFKPFIGLNRFGRESLHYYGAKTGKWAELETYGGKLTENVVQAIARDCLAAALESLEAAGYKTVMHIHDEVILDTPSERADLERVCGLMCKMPQWADGLLLRADGFVGDYYKKD